MAHGTRSADLTSLIEGSSAGTRSTGRLSVAADPARLRTHGGSAGKASRHGTTLTRQPPTRPSVLVRADQLEDRNGRGWHLGPMRRDDFAVETGMVEVARTPGRSTSSGRSAGRGAAERHLGSRSRRTPTSRGAVLAPAVLNARADRGRRTRLPRGTSSGQRTCLEPVDSSPRSSRPLSRSRGGVQTVIADYDVRADPAVRARDVALHRAKADGVPGRRSCSA